jgi:hypothetical protein
MSDEWKKDATRRIRKGIMRGGRPVYESPMSLQPIKTAGKEKVQQLIDVLQDMKSNRPQTRRMSLPRVPEMNKERIEELIRIEQAQENRAAPVLEEVQKELVKLNKMLKKQHSTPESRNKELEKIEKQMILDQMAYEYAMLNPVSSPRQYKKKGSRKRRD